MRSDPPLQASPWAKFTLLMWKNFLQIRRHPKQTVAEILIPVATMLLVLVLRSQIDSTTHNEIAYISIPAHSLAFSTAILYNMNLRQLSLAYSPESPVLEDVVRSAIFNLLLKNDGIIPVLKGIHFADDGISNEDNSTTLLEIVQTFVSITSYKNSDELKDVYYHEDVTRSVIAGIEFDDLLLGITELPPNISYALRFPEMPRWNSFFGMGGRTWRTNNLFPFFEPSGPRFPSSLEGGDDPGYMAEMFIALQHSISMEIVSRLSGEDLQDFTVNLQRLPHPAYVEDFAVEMLVYIFPMLFMLSFSYTAINIIRSVTIEKERQLKETMKIMGLPTWLHWTAWFCKQFVYALIVSLLLIFILKVRWFSFDDGNSKVAIFRNTSWTVLLFFIMLYLTSVTFFCFMISGIFSKATTAAICGGVIWFLSFIPGGLLSMSGDISAVVQGIMCLSFNSAMAIGFQLILSKENAEGMQWGQFFSSYSSESGQFLFGHVVIILLIDCALYMIIALYLEQVLPGPFGAPKPWYFFVQKRFWCTSKIASLSNQIQRDDRDMNEIVHENDPADLSIGVKLTNLNKVYGKNTVVDNLCLNIYDNQITVLLGHNGAGKSTTISMLTGNVEVSSGDVLVAGYNITTQTKEARANLGLCPQHDVLFSDLSVKEHLEFFARLKGYNGAQLNEEIDNLINSLELQDKRNYLAKGLSGGQKRRLCVGIALCGGARVVLLDEPTSGMDPASRRALWELLQKIKKGRSIILTTHFMDEADFLGDRVVIMSKGRLQCVGSPFFLKRHYGVGYTLVIVKMEDFDLSYCTTLINYYIPEAAVVEDRGNEVTFKLPNEATALFEEMLVNLERSKDTIKYKNYGLVATTLEDVFLRVGSDVILNSEASDSMPNGVNSEDDVSATDLYENVQSETGRQLFWLRVSGIWLKLFLIWKRSWLLLILQILIPILLMATTLSANQYTLESMPNFVTRPLTLSEGYQSTETLLNFIGTNLSAAGAIAKQGYEQLFTESNVESMRLTVIGGQSVDEYYLDRVKTPALMNLLRKNLLVGATFYEQSATAWFSNFAYHDIATSLAAVHSALLKGLHGSANLNVFNHPLEVTYRDNLDLEAMATSQARQLATSIGNSLAIISSVFLIFYIKERVTRAKLLQKAAGIQPLLMWGSAAIFDYVWFLILALTFIIVCAVYGIVGMSTFTELGRLYLCLMIYGAAMLPLSYLFSFLFDGSAVGFMVIFFVNSLFGVMIAQIVDALANASAAIQTLGDILDYTLQFFPLYSFVSSIWLLNQIRLTEYTCLEQCDYFTTVFPEIGECTMQALCENFSPSCCVSDNPYFQWEKPGIMRYVTCMIISLILFWFILMVIEYNWIQRYFIREKFAPQLDTSNIDPDVLDEMRHVERANTAARENCLLAKGLTKYYGEHLAVNQTYFSVGKSECFGLLGVNGAGKTTTFKMLMGDETISSGDAFVSGYSIKSNITKVHQNIGYCPQFDAVFGELTGRETLHLFSRFRGLRNPSSPARAQMLANALGFTPHLDKRVSQYSGGNRRKLSTAVALLGRTRLVFVDEPTTGVDPASKRQVWRAVRAARRAGRSFVLTSHSMEECEALCSRLTIMVNGQFQCLGSPQHLKNKFSQGFTLTIKMKISDNTSLNPTRIQNAAVAIKNYVNAHFSAPKLMEEYQGLLTYYLPDNRMPWSKMFGVMERAKRGLEIEDYSIQQTTLEQVFLQFTKYQRESRQ